MKNQGMALVEILLSITIFTIGLLALGATIIFGLKITTQSWNATTLEQEKINSCETYLSNRMFDSTVSAGTYNAKPIDAKIESLKIGNRTIAFDFYKFETTGKKGSEIYIIQREAD